MAAVQLNNVAGTLLPPTITGPIFLKASETSAVMQLCPQGPAVGLGQHRDPCPHGHPHRRVGL